MIVCRKKMDVTVILARCRNENFGSCVTRNMPCRIDRIGTVTNASQAHYIHITSRRLYGKHTLALYGILYYICHYQMRTRICAPIALGFLSCTLSFHIPSCIDVYNTPLLHTAIQSFFSCLCSAHYIILHVVISGILPI